MEETKHFPFFPANYLTLQQLKEEWMKEKQQKEEKEERKKQQEREEEERKKRQEREEEERRLCKEKEVEEEERRLRKEKEEESRLRKKIEEKERRRKEKEEAERRLRKEKEEEMRIMIKKMKEEEKRRKEKEQEERRQRKEKEEEERRLRKEKEEEEEEEERERLKKEEEKEKKLKEPDKSYNVAGSSNQSKSHGRRRFGDREEKKGLVEHECREVQGVDKEQTSEERPRKKQAKRKNRRKTVEDKATTVDSPARLTHDGNQSPIQGPDSSATTESQRQGYRRANFASQADNLSLGADNTPKSEAKIKSRHRERRDKWKVARELSDLKIIANETGEKNSIFSETEFSKAIVFENGISPEAGNRQKFEDAEVDGNGTTTVAVKRGGRRDRYPRRDRLRGRREKFRDLKIIANETGESNGIVSETEFSKAIVFENGISPEAGNRKKFGDVEVDGDGTATVGKEVRLRSVAGKRGGSRDGYPRRGSLRGRRRENEKSGMWVRKEELSGGDGDRRALDFRGD